MEASALSPPAGLPRVSLPAPLLRLRSDAQLVALFRAGDEAAFQAIHDRYRQRLFAYARQMLAGSRQDAEDALQDVFLRAYSALRADGRPVSLRAWLYRVAHNRCIDHLRRPVLAHSDVFEMSRTPLHDPIAEAQRREDLRRLVEDVRRLPDAQRSALLMREMEGLTYDELAAALDTTVPAIKSLLVRARIGLVEAVEARNTDCCDIRDQLALACDRGVRASAQARRHVRECAGCREYRQDLRSVRQGFAALAPSAPLAVALLAKLGLGGSGAAAGGGATAGGSGGVAVLGSATIASVGKVAAIVASVAVVSAGAVNEVTQPTSSPAAPHAHVAAPVSLDAPPSVGPALSDPTAAAPPAPAQAQAQVPTRVAAPAAPAPVVPAASAPSIPPVAAVAPATVPAPVDVQPADLVQTGGTQAPPEPTTTDTSGSSSSAGTSASAGTSGVGSGAQAGPVSGVAQDASTGGPASGSSSSGSGSGSAGAGAQAPAGSSPSTS